MEKLLDILVIISSPIKRKDCSAQTNNNFLDLSFLIESYSMNFENNISEKIKAKELLFGQTKNVELLEENEVSIDWFDISMEFIDTEEMHEVQCVN